MIIKKCFICKGKGHILSRKQVQSIANDYTDKRGHVDWDKVEKHIMDSDARCNLCDGTTLIRYPYGV